MEEVGYTLLGETKEQTNVVFPNKVTDVIAKYSKYIHMIHITDQKCYSAYPLVLKICLLSGETKESMDDSAKVFKFVVNTFIDHLANIKLTGAAKDAAKRNRSADEKKKNIEKQEQLKEDAQKKKDDKDLAERERIAKLPAAQRAKAEEKLAKKDKKREQKRQFKTVKF